jgi:hypothetical protein
MRQSSSLMRFASSVPRTCDSRSVYAPVKYPSKTTDQTRQRRQILTQASGQPARLRNVAQQNSGASLAQNGPTVSILEARD